MLKDNLAKKILNKGDGFKQSVLARKAGVKEETLSQILNGNTKNPGIYTVAKIADALNCSIDELIGRDVSSFAPAYSPSSLTKNTIFIDNTIELVPELGRECVIAIANLLHQKNHKVSFAKFLYLIKEIYLYCLEKNSKTVDMKFASWFIEHSISKI